MNRDSFSSVFMSLGKALEKGEKLFMFIEIEIIEEKKIIFFF